MRELLVSFVIVFTLQTLTNKPPLPEVQAGDIGQDTEHKQVTKKKEVNHATKKRKPITKPLEAPRVVKPNNISSSGSCDDWIRSAGISDVGNASELIRRESGCNPSAVNPSSGACGVAQELPCGKSGCQLGDGACQVKWMASYVSSRYGSWAAAVAFHDRNSWY